MIIEIRDAPAVKHITIDIDFDDNGIAKTTIIKDEELSPNPQRDTALNLTEDFEHTEEEVVEKPSINLEERVPKVVDDMQNMEL